MDKMGENIENFASELQYVKVNGNFRGKNKNKLRILKRGEQQIEHSSIEDNELQSDLNEIIETKIQENGNPEKQKTYILDIVKRSNIHVIWSYKKCKERKGKQIFEYMMTTNLQKMMQDIHSTVQKSLQTREGYIKPKLCLGTAQQNCLNVKTKIKLQKQSREWKHCLIRAIRLRVHF